MAKTRPRVLSGIQANGKLHIGNYIGAISVWAADQDLYESFFCIANLHALTIPENVRADELRALTREVAALYIACGIDPERSVVFAQSDVSAHAELEWLLACVTPLGWMERMTQFKVKAGRRETIGTGLLMYPVLQAADILVYQADLVPVGDDQRQHVEITRDIGGRFNNLFDEVFTLPQSLIRESGARIMGLDDPTEKMSKSIALLRQGHAVGLLDPPAVARRAIMRAKTDSRSEVDFEDLGPGVENLLTIYEVLSDGTRAASRKQFEGAGYGALKTAVADVVTDRLDAIQREYAVITSDPGGVDRILARGAERAREVANATLDRAMRAVGLR